MLGKKLVLFKNGQTPNREEVLFEVPHLEEIRHFVTKNIKKYGHMGLVITLRFYIRSSNFLKYQYEEVKIKIKNVSGKNKNGLNGDLPEKAEVNKFLKMISDYKNKIREIKHKIHEEERNL
ncbi:MAG: hypothetical protein G01um101424_289 [Parcubacteria group bacterium Gr01-1014_24]|nr:MAG: hypothetical protein G01um101424_289 [Parcubacteria group bacterium Gr01-1014_24]